MKKLKVVQIGTGHDHAMAPIGAIPKRDDAELIGYVRIPGETKTFDGVPELALEDVLERRDIDAVFIETEDKDLTDHALEFVRRGIPVQMDKPGGQDKRSFDALFDLAKQKNVPLHMGYMYRYNPAVRRLLERVRRGELGKIHCVEAQMNCLHVEKKREWLKGYRGGMMNYLGCHLIDLVLQIMGMPDAVIPYNAATQPNVGEDIGFAVLLYDGRPSFVKSAAVECSGFMRRQIVVCGERGSVEINPTEYYCGSAGALLKTDCYTSFLADRGGEWVYRPQKEVFGPYDRYDAMFDEFFKIVRGEIENPYSYEYEKQLHDVLLRACNVEIS